MDDFAVAEELLQEKIATNKKYTRRHLDKLKAERAKDYTRFPARHPKHPSIPELVDVDLRRVKKLSDLPEE